MAGPSVLQVPETCDWNPYVAAAEQALVAQGVDVLTPGLCRDVRAPSQPAASSIPGGGSWPRPDVVHLHWPEKLVHQLGVRAASGLAVDLARRGAVVVQTVHNVGAHEGTAGLRRFQSLVDSLSDGIHVFSPEHERLVRRVRPHLPDTVLHLPHPQYPSHPSRRGSSPSVVTLGCVGRLREYKRTTRFVRAFLDAAPDDVRLVVAGEPDTAPIDREMRALAAGDARLDYRPGFLDERTFWSTLADLDWLALPYERIYSSGVLVAALQVGTRVLSPTPAGGRGLYCDRAGPSQWLTVDPWDDEAAVAAWLPAHRSPGTTPPAVSLPSWDEAATRLRTFYRDLLASRTARPRPPATDHPLGEDCNA